jgi:hypothetical protein
MFSAILPTADIRRTERNVRQHFSGLPASNSSSARQGMSKLYSFTPTMPACRTVCAIGQRRRRLQLTVGTEG